MSLNISEGGLLGYPANTCADFLLDSLQRFNAEPNKAEHPHRNECHVFALDVTDSE